MAASAQTEAADSVYTFRFRPGKNMFMARAFGNDREFARLENCVSTYRTGILSGVITLHVDGYCHSGKTKARCLRTAAIRSNRVKSELIVRHGLKEEHFSTHNHADEGDFVTVRIIVPKPVVQPQPAPVEEKPAESPTPIAEVADTAETHVATHDLVIVTKTRLRHHFSVRANLLRWATLTPDLGIEWCIGNHVGVVVSGSWTSWCWNDKDRRYALGEVIPEVRYYIYKEKGRGRGYVGAMYKVGTFNYKFSETGRQGNIQGGGLTGGYTLPLNRALALDFSLGVGCLHATYDKYNGIDGVRVRAGRGTKNWWGPTSLGVTLAWNLF